MSDACAVNFATRYDVTVTDIDVAQLYLRTAGYSAVGDGGSALYKRAGTEPSHPGKVQSHDGAWWEIAEDNLRIEQFGGSPTLADNALALTNGCSAAFALGKDAIHIGAGSFALLGDFSAKVRLVGAGADRTFLNGDKAITFTETFGGLENISFTSTRAKAAALTGQVVVDGCAHFHIREAYVEWLPIVGSGYLPATSRRLITIANTSNIRVEDSIIKGGSLWISSNNTNIRIVGNDFHAEEGFGDDYIKLTTHSSLFTIEDNYFENANQDCIDLYTEGSKGTIIGNRSVGCGFIGINCKSLYRWPPYSSGSSDRSGRAHDLVFADNIFIDSNMRNVVAGTQAAVIYVHTQDLRISPVQSAASSTGLIKITATQDHGLSTGDLARVEGVAGTTEANGVWTVSVIDNRAVTLDGTTFTNAYVNDGRGTITRAWEVTGASAADITGNVKLTVVGHLFSDGNTVKVTGVVGTTEANVSDVQLRVVDADHVELLGVVFAHAYSSGGYISLILSVKNAPTTVAIANNLVDGAGSGSASIFTAGIQVAGGNVALTGNIVRNVKKNSGAPLQSGAGLLIGRNDGSMSQVMPTDVTVNGGIYCGEGSGLAVSDFVSALHVSGAAMGQDAESGQASLYGLVFGPVATVDRMTINGGILAGSSRSVFASGSTGYTIIRRLALTGVCLAAAVELPAELHHVVMDVIVDGFVILGSISKPSDRITVRGIIDYSGTAQALRIYGCTGVQIDAQIYGGVRGAVLTGSSKVIIGGIITPATGNGISSAADSGSGAVTLQLGSPHGLVVGDIVSVSGSSYSGVWTVAAIPNASKATLSGSTFTSTATGTLYTIAYGGASPKNAGIVS